MSRVVLKTDDEIAQLRKAAQLVSRGLAEAARLIAPGVTTAYIDSVVDSFLQDHGGRPAFKGYDPNWGGGPFPGACCMSVNNAVVHGLPSSYALREGDILTVDVGVELGGFFGDSAYTFAVGEISPSTRKLLDTTYEALHLGASKAIVGNRVGDIGYAVEHRCTREGYGVVRQLVGHGIGKSLHEAPEVPNVGRRGSGMKLEEGMVFCIEPMINAGSSTVKTDTDLWTVITKDGSLSAHYEHMVAVRKGSPEILTDFSLIEEHLAYVPTIG
jgi:methionyl aminopeptidase